MNNRILISICIPTYNEAENIPKLLARLDQFTQTEPTYDFEFLFTDNASEDSTFELLAEYANSDNRIRVIKFSRNFGFQNSILTNFIEAKGAAAVQIDADLQDPPELISEFLRCWERGYKVVYGVRRRRKESASLGFFRRLGYRTISQLSSVPVPNDAGDFRLIDRVIIEHLKNVRDGNPYLRGIIAELGYPQLGLPYDREARVHGDSKFRLWSLIRLGFDGVCSQSTKPLQLITLLGFALSGATAILLIFYVVAYLAGWIEDTQGFTTIVLLVLGSTSVNTFFLGVLGEYIGRTFQNTRIRPTTIIEARIEPIIKPRAKPESVTTDIS